jgi:DNA-binding NarL/FixJ family response regulator
MSVPVPSVREAEPAFPLEWPTRVLIVDDAASTRRFLRAVLQYCPEFDVAGEAGDGATAIEMAEALQPDVILLDLAMPTVDGTNALGPLREVAPKAKVIILSGVDRSAAATLIASGATAFIPKGLVPFALLERLGSIVGRSVTLPMANSTGPGAASHYDRVSQAPPRGIICDDNEMARHVVAGVLEACDVEIIAETDVVPDLVKIVDITKPELVVLDMWLEGTTGASALPEIRRISPRTAVIVYSAYEELMEKALDAGATAFVAKPNFEELEAQVHRLTPVASS